MIVAIALAIVLAVRVQRRPHERRVMGATISSWIFVALLQAAVGYVQYFNDVPALLVGVHVAGATALWAMTVWLVLVDERPGDAARHGPAESALVASEPARAGRCTLSLHMTGEARACVADGGRMAGGGRSACSSLVGFGAPAHAQTDDDAPQSVQGRVQNRFVEDGDRVTEPVADVRIVVVDASGAEIAEATTDEDGQYQIGLDEPGTYVVRLDTETLPEDLAVEDGQDEQEAVVGGNQRVTRVFFLGENAPRRREQVGPPAADARQRPQAGDDHRHHVGRAVADLRHDRAVQLRPR